MQTGLGLCWSPVLEAPFCLSRPVYWQIENHYRGNDLVNYSCLPMEMHLFIFSHYMFNRLLLLNFVNMLCLFAFFCLVLLYSSYLEEIKIII